MTARQPPGIEQGVARLLAIGTLLSVGLIVIGTALMLADGRSPLDVAPWIGVDQLVPALLGLQPAAFLWLGIVGVLVTPAARVLAALVGFARAREWPMVGIAAAILAVIAVGVVIGSVGA